MLKERDSYALIDSGKGRKLERFGSFLLSRPCAQAVWEPQLPEKEWLQADATFMREGDKRWAHRNSKTEYPWEISVSDIRFKISPTEFGHLGIFPEQRECWQWIQQVVSKAKDKRPDPIQILNLFAYSGGSTLAAAKSGAHVCHLDASKGMVTWARENASINHLETAPIRWIVEDVAKFLQRELKRNRRYDAIILDPPSFGRGNKGEIFKIEDHLGPLLSACRQLLSEKPLFVFFSCHTPGFTPIVMQHLMTQMMTGIKGSITSGEMVLSGNESIFTLPSGSYARWEL